MSNINLLTTLAHAGDTHTSTIETSFHQIPWLLQLGLFGLGVAVLAAIFWLLTSNVQTTVLAVATVLVISGFLLFIIAPVISMLSLIFGLTSTLFATLVNLNGKPK